jgi:hypothetical protein
MSTAGPLGGVRAEEPGAPTINARKCWRRAPWELPELEIQGHPLSTLKMSTSGPLGGAEAGDLGHSPSTLKTSTVGPWEVPELEIWERLPSALEMSTASPLGGARARDPGALNINARKCCESASGPLVDFGVWNDNLIKWLISCVKRISMF